MQRLGINQGGYRGERIDVHHLLPRLEEAARLQGWQVHKIPVGDGRDLLALHRPVANPRRTVYVSAGIHGDEPAGPLAAHALLEEDQWPADTAIWLCPCLNPAGLERNLRGNADGTDLNRDYRDPQSPEVRAHVRWLDAQPAFDFALCLHEDWEAHGFYAYEINPEGRPSLAARIVRAVSTICPIDQSATIDGWAAHSGVIIPNLDPDTRPQWPEAIYLSKTRTRQTCTLEAPSDFPLQLRVQALVTGVRAAWQEEP